MSDYHKTDTANRFKVNVIYHHYPHYRAPVMRELTKSGAHDYTFWGSLESVQGIKAFTGDDIVTIKPLKYSIAGNRWVLKEYWGAVFDKQADALIVLANPNMLATWFIVIVARLKGKKVLFWAHGWLKKEAPLKRFIRNFYFNLSNHVIVYAERAKVVAKECGFNNEKITVVYNSLDYERAVQEREAIAQAETKPENKPQALFSAPDRPLIICTARVTELCRFDLLFNAARKLQDEGKPINILLVGDGPKKDDMKEMAEELGISVHFYDACYDEAELARLIYWSDLTVSPDKIGLTAMHTLTYGTPVITHSDLDNQMPEVEAIESGVTGLLFERDNADDLAFQIEDWLSSGRQREVVRQACYEMIANKWNPKVQRRQIDKAVTETLSKSGPI